MDINKNALIELFGARSNESVSAEIARLSAELTLPKATVHVVSDVHGEDKKLRHIINNASGRLRPVVERLFDGRREPLQIQYLLKLLFYPRETLEQGDGWADSVRVRSAFRDVIEVAAYLARTKSYQQVRDIFPIDERNLIEDLVFGQMADRGDDYFNAVLSAYQDPARFVRFMRSIVRVVRNLAIDELVVAGDLYDRGPRADRAVDYIQKLPNVWVTWGNHDIAWIGAALGHEALIASVMRVSVRYQRLMQLVEGYGISAMPLELLARSEYSDDPAECFTPRGEGLRDSLLAARMQKAAAIMQFKLEGQLIDRNPHFQLAHRRVLHGIDRRAGIFKAANAKYTLRDSYFPTINPEDPYTLTASERECVDRLRQSFLSSDKLWEHVQFLVDRGSVSVVRDNHLIFHGCVPVDSNGEFQSFAIDGEMSAGPQLFAAFERVVRRAVEMPSLNDLDVLWYLWCGPRSPLFGKDRIATFERDMVYESESHKETKNDYFTLIHNQGFCQKVLEAFGADPELGMIVNGHVPVKIQKGEDPLKRSGNAITIDGAFSEAYGDCGYTLILEPAGTCLAKHHHFESVEAAVRDGIDIIPELRSVREYSPPRTVGDTERGHIIREQVEMLKRMA